MFTEVFDEDWTGGETLVTMTFVEHAGKTTCTQSILYASRASRDGALKTAMAEGMAMSYDRLESGCQILALAGWKKAQAGLERRAGCDSLETNSEERKEVAMQKISPFCGSTPTPKRPRISMLDLQGL